MIDSQHVVTRIHARIMSAGNPSGLPRIVNYKIVEKKDVIYRRSLGGTCSLEWLVPRCIGVCIR